MKKLLNIILFFITINAFFLGTHVNAETLNSLNIELDKEILHPGEEVNVNIDFGQTLSSYEINVAYDNKLFEYVSNNRDVNVADNGDVLTLTSNILSNATELNKLSIKFKAKNDITTTNPTDFKITVQNLVDGITGETIQNPISPVDKSLIVEPIYTEYKINLDYNEPILKQEIKNMKLVITSDMGKNYSNTKIYADVLTETDGNVEISAIDSNGEKIDFIYEGWGNEQGESLGGKNIVKELDLETEFSKAGNYIITFRVVDMNNSNFVIASKAFEIRVEESNTNIEKNIKSNTQNNIKNKPSTLPKAGNTIYFIIIPIGIILVLAYWYFKKRDEEI